MSKLSKKELAALDLLIAHLEEAGDQPVNLSFIGSMVNAVSHVAKAVTMPAAHAVANVANASANAAFAASRAAMNNAAFASKIIAAPAFAANHGGFGIGRGIFGADADSDTEVFSDVNAKATLKELIEIRNKSVK